MFQAYINFRQCFKIFLLKMKQKVKLYNPKPKLAMCSSTRNKVGGVPDTHFRVTSLAKNLQKVNKKRLSAGAYLCLNEFLPNFQDLFYQYAASF